MIPVFPLSNKLLWSLLTMLPLLGAGCAQNCKEAELRAQEAEKQVAELQAKNDKLASAIQEEKLVSARLQMALVEKQSKISVLKLDQAASKRPDRSDRVAV